MYLKIFAFCLFALALLSGCATATRGSTTIFIVETVLVGAHVTTTIPAKKNATLSRYQIKKIKNGDRPEPQFEYLFCEPTPCGIQMPRKSAFDVLITKEGYTPQIHTIEHLHRKEIARETARNTAIAASASAGGGALMAAGFASSVGGCGHCR